MSSTQPENSPRGSFEVAQLDYPLPPDLIAQQPPPRREDARLLVIDRASDSFVDSCVLDLPDLLREGDLLVLNDTKVLPAKFTARRKTGGKVRGLFVLEHRPGEWEVLLEGSRRLRIGESIVAGSDRGDAVELELLEAGCDGHWRVLVGTSESVEQILARIGETPLPPYIKRSAGEGSADDADRARYQTVYARRAGAIAAPTAGMHFTEAMLEGLRSRGIDTAFVTLHVGIGTFKPVAVEDLAGHVMHSEAYELTEATVEAISTCRGRGGRVIAVGTTSVRVLESAATRDVCSRTADAALSPGPGTTDLFVYPPYRFRVVDAIMTNFHLPRSTLLALVMAFAGIDRTRQAYAHAVEARYRFYSYGDAMLIL